MKRVIMLLAIVLPTLALFYFGLSRDPHLLPSALVGKPAPLFDLKTVDGKRYALADLKGTPVVVNFWSTWCSSCTAEHALFTEAAETTKPHVHFFSILYDDTTENAQEFSARHGGTVPILLDPKLDTSIDYGVSGVPETFFINRDGIVIFKQVGTLNEGVLSEKLDEITKEQP